MGCRQTAGKSVPARTDLTTDCWGVGRDLRTFPAAPTYSGGLSATSYAPYRFGANPAAAPQWVPVRPPFARARPGAA